MRRSASSVPRTSGCHSLAFCAVRARDLLGEEPGCTPRTAYGSTERVCEASCPGFARVQWMLLLDVAMVAARALGAAGGVRATPARRDPAQRPAPLGARPQGARRIVAQARAVGAGRELVPIIGSRGKKKKRRALTPMRHRLLLGLVAALVCAAPGIGGEDLVSAEATSPSAHGTSKFTLRGRQDARRGARRRRLRSTRPPAGCTRPRWSRRTARARAMSPRWRPRTRPGGGSRCRIEAAGDGALFLRAKIAGDADQTDVDAMRIGFASPSSERFFGFGERSNAVDQRGQRRRELRLRRAVPADGHARSPRRPCRPRASRTRDDATYYPVPWLLSSRGYGVLIDHDETSTFHLATDPRTRGAPRSQAPRDSRCASSPARRLPQVLRRFTAATGRQPRAACAVAVRPVVPDRPAEHGAAGRRGAYLTKLRKADAPVSAAETQLHYLPCGARPRQRGLRGRAREVLPRHGLAILTYVNPMLCASYEPLYDQAAAAGALQTTPPARPPRSTRSSAARAGRLHDRAGRRSSTSPPPAGATSTRRRRCKRALAAGPRRLDGGLRRVHAARRRRADGTRRPRCTTATRRPTTARVAAIARPRTPVVRFQRSGWTGRRAARRTSGAATRRRLRASTASARPSSRR